MGTRSQKSPTSPGLAHQANTSDKEAGAQQTAPKGDDHELKQQITVAFHFLATATTSGSRNRTGATQQVEHWREAPQQSMVKATRSVAART